MAASRGDLGVLKAIKPENYPHLLPRLLRAADFCNFSAVVDRLLSLGAPLNDRDDGTSSLLPGLLSQIEWDADPRLGQMLGRPSRIDAMMSRMEELLSRGARFPPIEMRLRRQHVRAPLR